MDRPLPCLVVALLVLLALAGAGGAAAQESDDAPPTIYKWVDENGIAHYTTDKRNIPRSLRGLVGRVGVASSDDEPVEPAGAATAAAAPATRSSLGADRWADTDYVQPYEDVWSDGADAAEVGDVGPLDPGQPAFEENLDPAAVAQALREIDARIAQLEDEIASDEDALKDILADPPGDTAEIAYHPDFRAVANRLPKLLAELRSLEDERANLETPAP